jgi:hypothetical protein
VPRPLRKRRPDGRAYTRPSEIDAAIDEALARDAETRIARAELRERKAEGFLPKEVLVYLIREAKHADDQATLTKLFAILARRCEAILVSQIPDSYPHGSDIRADTLSDLGVLIASDETRSDPFRLDFFEIRFERALLVLRDTIGRKYLRRSKREIVSVDPANRAHKPVRGALESDAEQEPTVLRKEQLALFNRLPAEDRKLLLLRYGNEIKVESTDSDQVTLATLYGVTGHTIRNRLAAARARLAELERKP